MLASEILFNARAILNDSGTHWTQREYVRTVLEASGDEITKRCAIGGLRRAAFGKDHEDGIIKTDFSAEAIFDPEYERAVKTLACVIRSRAYTSTIHAIDTIIDWNDTAYRTWSDIDGAFVLAAQLCKYQEQLFVDQKLKMASEIAKVIN